MIPDQAQRRTGRPKHNRLGRPPSIPTWKGRKVRVLRVGRRWEIVHGIAQILDTVHAIDALTYSGKI
jgi:hypothetical protein